MIISDTIWATKTIFHHTDSARLPWILRDQMLKPGSNRVGNYPDDFLWATPDPMGDPTASSAVAKNKYRDGDIAAVRFTLSATDFRPWNEMKASHPRWQAHHIAILESAAMKMGASPQLIAQWQCRLEPLPASRWLAVEFRTWRNPHGERCSRAPCALSVATPWASCLTALHSAPSSAPGATVRRPVTPAQSWN